jgi:hypothetical protein
VKGWIGVKFQCQRQASTLRLTRQGNCNDPPRPLIEDVATDNEIHRVPWVSPTMGGGMTDRLWSVEGLVKPWKSKEQKGERAADLNSHANSSTLG